MYGYIYKTTNIINGKIYIGQHKAEIFEPNKYIGSGTLLRYAINKYGKENFSNTLLFECFDQDELNKMEQYYINLYNSTDINIGYNIRFGGNEAPCPDYVKDKISKANKNKYSNHTYIHKDNLEKHVDKSELNEYLNNGWELGRSDKTKTNLSKGYNYSSKGMLGKKQSEKQKQAVSKSSSYKRNDKQKANFSSAKKIPNKFICLRTPDNSSTIRCLIKNKDYYLSLGYLECNTKK